MILIYGANGYTGRLCAQRCSDLSLEATLAGRNAEDLGKLSKELGLPFRVFPLHPDPSRLAQELEGADAVLHCAGPFSSTSTPMALACMAAKIPYLDITGEIQVLEDLFARSADAQHAGIPLLPGVGFDVVPSDCLAASLADYLPGASRLTLAIHTTGRASRGTLKSTMERLGHPNLLRREGVLIEVPAGSRTRMVDFPRGRVLATAIPWGDVSTAWYSTGVPNIETYMTLPPSATKGLRRTRWLSPLLRQTWVQNLAKRRIQAKAWGPSSEERARNRCWLWGRLEHESGEVAEAILETQDAYTLTAVAAVECASRASEAPPGTHSPSMAFGKDLALSLEGVSWVQEPTLRSGADSDPR